MVEVWPVYEGGVSAVSGPWARLSLDDAIALFQIRPEDFVGSSRDAPLFRTTDRNLSVFGYKYVLIMVPEDDQRLPEWPAGVYRSPLQPEEAFDIALKHRLSDVLGRQNVIRVQHGYISDWNDRSTFKVTVVVPPEARIAGEASLRANTSLLEMASTSGISGVPTLQYATEDELGQHED